MARESYTGGNFQFELQNALSAYSDEMYTNATKLSGTQIVGSNSQIDPSTETFIGQTRFFKPYSTQVVNVASDSTATDGNYQTYTSDFLTYVKTVRTHGAQEVNVQRVISQMDGLAKIARDFGEVRAQDEHDSIMAVLKGVAASEVNKDAGGIVGFDQDYSSTTTGFYVDVNASGAYGAAATDADDERDLIIGGSPGTVGYGAILGENLFKAVSLGYSDHEPDFCYMITSPETMTALRVANLVDQTMVTEGNLNFQTIFGGKFRLLMTRTSQGNLSTDTDVNARSTKTTFLVKPGALEMAQLSVPMPVEMFRDANKYAGSGSTDIWYRWGYVIHPMGYDWNGSTSRFASSVGGDDVTRGGLNRGAASNDYAYINGSNWNRKYDMLNLGILPIFHS